MHSVNFFRMLNKHVLINNKTIYKQRNCNVTVAIYQNMSVLNQGNREVGSRAIFAPDVMP